MLEAQIIKRTRRVPRPTGPAGDGAAAARQLDAALMQVGFKLSGELLEQLSVLDTGTVLDTGVRVLAAVRELVGDHVQHNVYFRDFPRNIPDTVEFWLTCLVDALATPEATRSTSVRLAEGLVSLLDLPAYGRYQHTYAEMLAAHDDLIPATTDRVTVLHLGGTPEMEIDLLFRDMASSRIPLSADDLDLLGDLALLANTEGIGADEIPVRENRAVINRVFLAAGRPLIVDTVTDVLRLACLMSDGDVTLETPTRFRNFTRRERRALLGRLGGVVAVNSTSLGDVKQHARAWTRLAGALHPDEYADLYPKACDVFAVARGDMSVTPLTARFETAFAAGDIVGAARLLENAPGRLMRSLDRLLRAADTIADTTEVLRSAATVADKVSGRVLLSVREHLANQANADTVRLFVNRKGRAWVTPDTRPTLSTAVAGRAVATLDAAIARRLPTEGTLLIDPAMLRTALPLSSKTTPTGMGVMPRGSVQQIHGNVVSFFIHWHQDQQRTDYDLSVLYLDKDFLPAGQVSYTNLRDRGVVHSGDITEAPDGASEFIDLDLKVVSSDVRYVVPQVNVYSGEDFAEVKEAFFGYMTRDRAQMGQPYEPRTVRAKSALNGAGRVALPMVFMRRDDGSWRAKWMNLNLAGFLRFNQVENNRLSTTLLARSIVGRDYLDVEYLAFLMAGNGVKVGAIGDGTPHEGPVTFVGLDAPEHLPEETKVITLNSLNNLVPE
ncbi:TerD family protein [Amycolatopsis sp. DSM 110486]|uniref:TerD family protein n=1 Tax=Amycolatopsis sp. DSM 110486 TaxID=2865832 RepID=UPI001C6A5218|nr:TerD family protein [Amycolatopsis sp. DSM 110486]QYN17581.1 TerD family protein [Amycolatopsis sp. DSM 110486]